MSTPQLIYAAAGRPPYPRTHQGTCRTCGHAGEGVPFDAWIKDTFTNHDLLRPGEIICDGCQFCTDTKSQTLMEVTGRDKLQRMTNYSHFVVDAVWYPYHKGQKPEILTALRSKPTAAVIAVSGQKHLCFRARPGWWQVEEQCMLPDLPRLEHCLTHVNDLYRVFNKTEIETGNYSINRMVKYTNEYGPTALLDAQQALVSHRGALVFELAVFLAQREEERDNDG